MVAPAAHTPLRLPPDLMAELIELEKRGELDALLERVKVRIKLRRVKRRLAADLSHTFAGPLREMFREVAVLATAEVLDGW